MWRRQVERVTIGLVGVGRDRGAGIESGVCAAGSSSLPSVLTWDLRVPSHDTDTLRARQAAAASGTGPSSLKVMESVSGRKASVAGIFLSSLFAGDGNQLQSRKRLQTIKFQEFTLPGGHTRRLGFPLLAIGFYACLGGSARASGDLQEFPTGPTGTSGEKGFKTWSCFPSLSGSGAVVLR